MAGNDEPLYGIAKAYADGVAASPKVASDTAPGVGVQAAWDAIDSLPPIVFTEAEARALSAALAASPTASDTDTAIPGGEDVLRQAIERIAAGTVAHLENGNTWPAPLAAKISQAIAQDALAASPKPDTDTPPSGPMGWPSMEAFRAVYGSPEMRDGMQDILAKYRLALPGVEGVREAEEVERDIRIAIWNAGMASAMGQNRTQAFIRRAMAEPMMARALAALAAKPIAGMDAGEVEDA